MSLLRPLLRRNIHVPATQGFPKKTQRRGRDPIRVPASQTLPKEIEIRRRIIRVPATETFPKGIQIRGRDHIRVARARNRLTSILRWAKAIPPKRPHIHPITGQVVPHIQATCHSCGRQFVYRTPWPTFQPKPNRKYCHRTCQASRPHKFDRWLESKIMAVLKKTHVTGKGKMKFRWISTDSIEKYIIRHRGKAFRLHDKPLHLTERIRQAARRLVAIPGRGGKVWQAIALEENTNQEEIKTGKKWIRQMYAPNRGNIMLGLIKADSSLVRDNMTEVKSFDAPDKKQPSVAQEITSRKINGRVLQNLPEWKGRFWYDESGRIRSSRDKRRPQYSGIVTRRPGDQMPEPLDLTTNKTYKWESKTKGLKGTSWKRLLAENRNVINQLTSERNKAFGLDV